MQRPFRANSKNAPHDDTLRQITRDAIAVLSERLPKWTDAYHERMQIHLQEDWQEGNPSVQGGPP